MLTSPTEIGERGERIYHDTYKDKYEKLYPGKFAAIDVETGKAYIGDSLLEAFHLARKEAPEQLFHFIRIGSPYVYRSRSASHGKEDRIF